jgi:hypothetical protein
MKETHHKVDPKEERVGRVEARAASEPFRAKSHPAVIEKGERRSALSVIIIITTATFVTIIIRHRAGISLPQFCSRHGNKKKKNQSKRTRHIVQPC